MSNAELSETTLLPERMIPSPPEVLFALWTKPAQLLKWWAPEGYEPSVHALDVRPGGHWRTTLRRSDGSLVATSGVYRIVEPPHRLSFTWAWEGENGARGHETGGHGDLRGDAPAAPALCCCNSASRTSRRVTTTTSAGRPASTVCRRLRADTAGDTP